MTADEKDAVQQFAERLREIREYPFGEVQATVKKAGGVLSFGEFGAFKNRRYR